MRKVKCPVCETLNEKEEAVLLNKRYYCEGCVAVEEADKKVRDKKREDWNELFEYICEVYGIDTLTGMMFKQIKDYKDNYNYTDKGIYLTLKYYYEILGSDVKENTGLGIAVYYYEEAKRHYIEKRNIANNEKNFNNSEHTKIIEVDFKNFHTTKKPLSFTSVEWEEETDGVDDIE